jgi:hypothetical protein
MIKARKFVSAILIGAAALSMNACGKSDDTSSVVTKSSVSDIESPQASGKEVSAKEKEEEAVTAAETTSGKPSSDGAGTDAGLKFGVVSGDVYTNESFDLAFKAPEGWVFSTDEEMLEQNKMEGKNWTEDAKMEVVESGSSFYDFYITCEEPYQMMFMIVKDAGIDIEAAGGVEALMDEDVRESLEQELGASGYDNCKVEKVTTSFRGESDVPAFRVTGEVVGMKIYETVIFVYSGKYFGTLTVASLEQDNTQDILGRFTRLS